MSWPIFASDCKVMCDLIDYAVKNGLNYFDFCREHGYDYLIPTPVREMGDNRMIDLIWKWRENI